MNSTAKWCTGMEIQRKKEDRQNLTLEQVKQAYGFWGRHPRLYAFLCRLVSLGGKTEESLRRRAVEHLASVQEGKILEIACGTGRDLPYVEQIVGPRMTLFALDYTPEMLEVAQQSAAEHKWENLHFIQGDAAVLPFRDGVFAGVLCVFGMSAIPGYPACLREALRVTKIGGRLVVCDGRPFHGGWRWVNPLITFLLRRTTCWAYERDIVSDLRRLDPELVVEEWNAGTLFIAELRPKAARSAFDTMIPFPIKTRSNNYAGNR